MGEGDVVRTVAAGPPPAEVEEARREPGECSHVRARRDGRGLTLSQEMGDFPHDVLVNIRHDHPTLGLSDVAYQRLHQEHTRRRMVGQSRQETASPGVVSLGLPLGISSLRIAEKVRKKKKSGRNRNSAKSDTETNVTIDEHFYQTLTKPSVSVVLGGETSRLYNNNNNNSEKRKSSLPRKIKRHQEQRQRPSSVDADLLLQSADKSVQVSALFLPLSSRKPERRTVSTDDILKFARLTSTSRFMAREGETEKSSSGNSSGSGSPPPPEAPPPAVAVRRREAPPVAVANKGPPPRHLLPARLRPSPARKMHPHVVIPHLVVGEGSVLSLTTRKGY